MRHRRVLVSVLVLGGVLLAACSSDSKKSAPSTTEAVNCGEGWASGSDVTTPTTSTPSRRATDACLRLNQVQVLGSHNSYHLQNEPVILNAIMEFD
jgi:hypothetical protein